MYKIYLLIVSVVFLSNPLKLEGVICGNLLYEFETGAEGGMAFSSDGSIYVVNEIQNRVSVFDRCGNLKFTFGGIDAPRSVAISPSGLVYVTQGAPADSSVQVFDLCGNFLFKFESDVPYGIAINDKEWIYVTNYLLGTVSVYNRCGHFLFSFGELGIDPGQFNFPHDVAISPEGLVYVVDFLGLQVFDGCGNFLFRRALPQQSSISSILISEDDIIYSGRAASVTALDRCGNFLFSFDTLATTWIAISPQGLLYVMTTGTNGLIQVYN